MSCPRISNGNPDAHLTALFDQGPGCGQTDPCEENVHEPLLQNSDLKVDGQQAGAPQDTEDEADHQAGHDHAGDTIGLKKFDPFYNGEAHHGHEGGQSGALHHIKADFQHIKNDLLQRFHTHWYSGASALHARPLWMGVTEPGQGRTPWRHPNAPISDAVDYTMVRQEHKNLRC